MHVLFQILASENKIHEAFWTTISSSFPVDRNSFVTASNKLKTHPLYPPPHNNCWLSKIFSVFHRKKAQDMIVFVWKCHKPNKWFTSFKRIIMIILNTFDSSPMELQLYTVQEMFLAISPQLPYLYYFSYQLIEQNNKYPSNKLIL